MKPWLLYNRAICFLEGLYLNPILILLGWIGRSSGWNEGPAQCWFMRNLGLHGWYPKGHLLTFDELQFITGRRRRQ